MTWWDHKAVRWQERNISDEAEHHHDFAESEVRRATVHTRQDITMIVAYLSALNRQIATVKAILAVLTAIALYLAVKLTLR